MENYVFTSKNQSKHIANANYVELKKIAKKPKAITLMRTGDMLDYEFSEGNLKVVVPEKLKAGNVTDVVTVEFDKDFDYKPYIFTHW